jgi:large subunit ribosomal protein L2
MKLSNTSHAIHLTFARTGTGKPPVDPWGNLTKGYRTRNNKRTQTFIVSRRKK